VNGGGTDLPTPAEQLTRQFYQWELRGRGWTVWPGPVELEPPFRAFPGHFLPPPTIVDDGRFETGWSRFGAAFLRGFRKEEPKSAEPPVEEEEPAARAIPYREDLVELQAVLPSDLNIPREAFEEFFASLHLCREPLAFEIVGQPSRIAAQFVAHPGDADLVRRELQAFFPDAVFLSQQGFLKEAWGEGEAAVVEFGLGKEFMQPLASGKLDPFVGIAGALAELGPRELGLFQVLFEPVRHPWAESIRRAVTDDLGKPFFANAPELTRQAEQKIEWPLYAVVVRIAAQAPEFGRAWEIARHLASSLRVFAHPTGNELIPLTNDDYPFAEHVEDVLRRQSRRSGMVLNSDELIGFVHLPQGVVRTPALVRQVGKTKPAPKAVLGSGLSLGENIHAGRSLPVRLTPEQRVRHTHVIGASGTGKSTLLFNMIKADVEAGQGVAVLDPHGDLADRVLGIIPAYRVGDVVLFDPADEEYSIGCNILSAHSELEQRLLASDLVSVFQRLSTSWGDQMGSVLRNGILAFLESREGGTLADLRRFLLEPSYRDRFLETVTDPEVVYYWRRAFPQLAGNKSIGPVLTRLETFLSPKTIRCMVSQKENRLDFAEILDTGKIFLAKLAQGLIGRENSYLLGTLLVSKLQQLAMSRQAKAAPGRRDFWLYVDEFHNFITPSMGEILSGVRKYRLGLILAHQELRQLQRDAEVASAVLSNAGTRICFRVGDDDAKKLADGFSAFEARDLQNLETGQAVCRVERSDWDFNLAVPLPKETAEAEAAKRRAEVIAASRKRYATPRAEVEAALRDAAETEERPSAPEARRRKEKPAVEPPTAPAKPLPAEAKEPPPAAPPPPAKPPLAPEWQAEKAQAPAPLPPAIPESEKSAPVHAGPEKPSGLRRHEALKERFRREAEALDYTVGVEQVILNGHGQVDLVLKRGSRSIACQISVKNSVEYEAANARKCLEEGFAHVAIVSEDRRKLEKIRETAISSLAPEHSSRLAFYLPEEFENQLCEWAARDPAGGAAERAKPRTQRIRLFGGVSEAERKEREPVMLAALAEVIKRRKNP
jgi:DNA helicase HerA-like ATPase